MPGKQKKCGFLCTLRVTSLRGGTRAEATALKHLTAAPASREPNHLVWSCSKGAQVKNAARWGLFGARRGRESGTGLVLFCCCVNPKGGEWDPTSLPVCTPPGLAGTPNQHLLLVVPKSLFQHGTSTVIST